MRFVNVPPGPLDAKAVDGLTEFAKSWPGEMLVVTSHDEPAHDAFRVVHAQDIAGAVEGLKPDVISALHRPEFEYLNALGRTVYVSEVPRRVRTDIQLVTARSPLDRFRIRLGQTRREISFRRMARESAGLQCNGWAAWNAYAGLNARPMRFREHRIPAEELERAKNRPLWDGTRPLRVAFSGRISAIKGPGNVIEVARRLPHVEFEMIGDGELRERLELEAPDNVRFLGRIPFDDWMPYVRQNVDVALLPHPQGDPSGTYHEMLGCGVPVVGLSNETWKYLAQHEELGWAESSVDGLARRIDSITPQDIRMVVERAWQLIEPFEVIAARRVEHLHAVATS